MPDPVLTEQYLVQPNKNSFTLNIPDRLRIQISIQVNNFKYKFVTWLPGKGWTKTRPYTC